MPSKPRWELPESVKTTQGFAAAANTRSDGLHRSIFKVGRRSEWDRP